MFMNTSISVKKKNCRNLLPLIHRIMFITDLDLKLFVIMDKKKPAFVTSAVFVLKCSIYTLIVIFPLIEYRRGTISAGIAVNLIFSREITQEHAKRITCFRLWTLFCCTVGYIVTTPSSRPRLSLRLIVPSLNSLPCRFDGTCTPPLSSSHRS